MAALRVPARSRPNLARGPMALAVVSLVVIVTAVLRTSTIVTSDNAVAVAGRGAHARPAGSAVSQAAQAVGAVEGEQRFASAADGEALAHAQPALASATAEPAAARATSPAPTRAESGAALRAELDAFVRERWPARVPTCGHLDEAHVAGLANLTAAAHDETFQLEAANARWLTRARARALAAEGGGVLIVTWANAHFSDFVENFALSLQRLGLRNYLVGALDDELLELLAHGGRVPGAHTFRMLADGALEAGARAHWGWGSPLFNQMGRHKGVLMRSLLAMGVELLLCDVDTVWLRDPLPFLARYPASDLLITSDILRPSRLGDGTRADEPLAAADGGLEDPTWDVGHVANAQLLLVRSNIGVMLLRPSVPMRLFIEEYMGLLTRAKGGWDQSVFNDLMRKGFRLSNGRLDRLTMPGAVGRHVHEVARDLEGVTMPVAHADRTVQLYCGHLRVGVLPTPAFAHGHGFFVSRLHEQLGVAPYVVHNTYQYHGSLGKRFRFREAGLWWADAPARGALGGGAWARVDARAAGAYATPPSAGGGLLRAVLHVSRALLERSVDLMVPSHAHSRLPLGHAALVQHQLAQVAGALALARALRRTLELPALACACDKTFMVAWNCSYWPSALRRPFRCPLDHVYDLPRWEELGLPFREPGFGEGEHVEARVREGAVRVHVCGAGRTAMPPEAPGLARLASEPPPDEAAAACARAHAAAATADGGLAGAFGAANRELRAAGGAARLAVVPRGLTDEQLHTALAPFADAPALALDSLDGLFGGFARAQNGDSFRASFERALVTEWCCTPVGGYRYNFTTAPCNPGAVRIVNFTGHDRALACE